MSPEQIPTSAYTHLNFAFAFVDPKTYAIAPMASDQVELYKRTTSLKELNPGMEVWISVGGWSMNVCFLPIVGQVILAKGFLGS